MHYRIFQGQTTRQVDGHTTRQAMPDAWYYEPRDYEGDVLYSGSFATREAAAAAADAEFTTAAALRLDSRIDHELDRLGWSSTTAPDDASTLDCWNTPTTEVDGIVTLHDPQEVTAFHGQPLLDTLRALPTGVSWDDLWHAIMPHMLRD